jgi:predicted DNA-binding transcriptional regulator AlpA
MTELLTPTDIATALQVPRRELVERISKRADFPRPALVLGKKNKRWAKEDIEAWIQKNIAKNRR